MSKSKNNNNNNKKILMKIIIIKFHMWVNKIMICLNTSQNQNTDQNLMKWIETSEMNGSLEWDGTEEWFVPVH